MKFSSLVLLIALGAAAGFAFLNWSVFITPTELSLGFTTAQIPLGMVMLGMLVFISLLFVIYIVFLQSTVLFDARRHSRELQANRELADQAEASRFTELRTYLEGELSRQSTRASDMEKALNGKLGDLEQALTGRIEHAGNTLAAYIGELEDRLDKTRPGA